MNVSLGKWLLLVFVLITSAPLCGACSDADDFVNQTQDPFGNSPATCACYCHVPKSTDIQTQTNGTIEQTIKFTSYLPTLSSLIETAVQPLSIVKVDFKQNNTLCKNPALPNILRI